ncbi:MAG TPA: hypothetical protein PKM41_08945 [Deltaproteobacteria bacterium]|jgi:hypothetical protein|nr:hypothetical protein [Deltaproteobacteria bacterium]HOI07404.1 hypothetical protein [Deltaproteobacteria bacterium]
MKKLIVLAVLAVAAVSGCAGIPVDRKVEDNTFISMADPMVQIRVDPTLDYLGKVGTARHHQSINGTTGLLVNYSSYLFLERDKDNVIKRGVVIRVDRIGKGSWKADLFADVKSRLVSDYLDIGGRRYEHFIAVRSDIFTDVEMAYIHGSEAQDETPVTKGGKATRTGWALPKCFMVEGFGVIAGAGSDTRMCVYYFEDVEEIDDEASCRDWLRGEMSPEDLDRAKLVFTSSRDGYLSFGEKLR